MRHDHGERWGPRDLIRRVQNAFDVAGRAVDAAVRYRLQSDSHTGADANLKVDEALGDVRPLVMTKVVAEAAMLLRCAAPLRHVDGQMSSIIDDLAQRIIAPARGRRLLTLLCLEPTLALDHAAAHIHLSDLGFRDPAVDRMLLEIFQGEVIGGPERYRCRNWSSNGSEESGQEIKPTYRTTPTYRPPGTDMYRPPYRYSRMPNAGSVCLYARLALRQ
jgi:hypothetical protein